MEVCPTRLHAFSGLGERLWPCPSEYSVRSSSGVWSVLPVAASHLILLQPLLELGPHCWQQVRLLVGVGLQQDCPLSPIQFIIFMDRISRCSPVVEGTNSSLLIFSDYVFLISLAHQVVSSSSHCNSSQPSVTWREWESAPLNQRPWSTVGRGAPPSFKLESFKPELKLESSRLDADDLTSP